MMDYFSIGALILFSLIYDTIPVMNVMLCGTRQQRVGPVLFKCGDEKPLHNADAQLPLFFEVYFM